MQEKNSNHSNSLGICQRLLNFFMNNLIARGLKRVTLGQPLPQGYDHSLRPAKSSGELMVHYKDHRSLKQDLGSEIEIMFKQSEELPLVQEKIEPQVQGKSSQVVLEPHFTTVIQSRSVSEKEDRRKMKGKSIPSENLTLSIEDEEPKSTPRRLRLPLSVAPNINEKSDEFIRTKKEAMSRTMGMEPKKKS